MKLTNEIVIEKGKTIGFDLVGFTKAGVLKDEGVQLEEWLKKGYQAGMSYMERNREKRKDIFQILPGAKSVVSLAINYYTNHQYSKNIDNGKISRYAWGKDYHLIIWEKLEKLEKGLKEIDPAFECKSYVDTGPVMDKVWAVRSGIGWLGKHTNVINKELGSWIFIANLITNYKFDYTSQIPDYCGNCTVCIDACPTDAIVQEYVVDSNRCISYLTIENKGEISKEFKGKFNNWLFGCDICQDVCPWNYKFAEQTVLSDFNPINNNMEISLLEIRKMSEKDFKERFSDSPVSRAKLSGLKRNSDFLSD